MKVDDKVRRACVEVAVKTALSTIGPEKSFSSDETILSFEDDLKTGNEYWSSGWVIRWVLHQSFGIDEDALTYSYCSAVFKDFCKFAYGLIKERSTTIAGRLDQYVTDADIPACTDFLRDLIAKSRDRHRITLVTDLIELRGIPHIAIGNVRIRQVNEELMKMWPDSFQEEDSLKLLFSPESYGSKADFLKKHANHSALEIEVEGHHYANTTSQAFELALTQLNYMFAYLRLCEFFLKSVANDKFKMEQKDIPYEFMGRRPSGTQLYYICKIKEPNRMTSIETKWRELHLTRNVFIITPEFVSQITSRCSYEIFNAVLRDESGEIRNKILRALDWFLKADLEENQTDEVLCLFICLESLMSLGFDQSVSHTDELASNIALMLSADPKERYQEKINFKKLYSHRNKIVHHGHAVKPADYGEIVRPLMIGVAWSIVGILRQYSLITKLGRKVEHMKEYFERRKLSCP